MSRAFRQSSGTVKWTVTGSAVSVDDVIEQNELLGVAAEDGAVGDLIAVHTAGVFALPKAAETIAFGERLFWDGTALTATATSNRFAGLCVQDGGAASGDATVEIDLNAGAIAGGV